MNRIAQVTELLTELVNCRTDQREEALAAVLTRRLEPWGARITTEEVTPGRTNFIATFAGTDPTHSVMLEAHGDTVGGDAPFQATVRDGRLYGRGSCDTKGSMTAMLLGIRDVLERDGRPPVTVHFVSTCDEELHAAGAHALVTGGFRVDFAVVGEPTDLKIVHMHKGVLRMKIFTDGVAAHSSDPGRGVNAIYRMARVIDALENRVAPSLQAIRHPLLGSPTLSVGTIRGGTQVNIVPAECEIEVDRRLVPGESADEALAAILAGLDVRHTVTGIYPALGEPRDGRAASPAARACQRVLGAAEFGTVAYGTNAGVFERAAIPCVVFGPGSITQAHTRDEYVELAEVARAVDVYAAILRDPGP